MSGLRKGKIRLDTVLLDLTCKIKPAHNIDKAVEDISRLSKGALSILHLKHPMRVKSAIRDLLDRVEFDKKERLLSFPYIIFQMFQKLTKILCRLKYAGGRDWRRTVIATRCG